MSGGESVKDGRRAEGLAREYLARKGLKIIDANRRLGGGELDLVAMDGPVLVFVEVKARRFDAPYAPEESVDKAKQRRLVSAADAYLAKWQGPLPACRFDVVAVQTGDDGPKLRHLPDAFRPEA